MADLSSRADDNYPKSSSVAAPPLPDLTQAVRQFKGRAGIYRTFTAYYNGDHPLAFATEKFRNAFGRLFFAFSDNLCPAVIDAVSDRLVIESFGIGKSADPSIGKLAWDLWSALKMVRKAGEIHQEALRCGDAYAIVWPDPVTGQPRVDPQMAGTITCRYDDESPEQMVWAGKLWATHQGLLRLNLYYADRIEKYITRRKVDESPERPSAWAEYPGDGEPWPLPNPYGVIPVFHFVNNSLPGTFGQSELKNIIPIQNALNKSVLDMMVAMEFVALPQRWATGIEAEIDELTGKPILPFQPGVDRIWLFANDQAKLGEFPGASLEGFLKAQESFRMEVARISGTPLHYFMMQSREPPSGEALKGLEERLLNKVADRQQSFGETWANLMKLALQISGQGSPDLEIVPKWVDPTPKSPLEEAQTQQIKQQIGVSQKRSLLEMGYTEADIEEMQQDNDDQQVRHNQLGAQLLTSFERGGPNPNFPSRRVKPGASAGRPTG